jgi:sec-independent protein translocase protein TatB
MLPRMFGIGGSEILVILIVALIFLGPEKLPDAATKISKGIRELRRQTRDIQQTIENDTEIGGAIRDLKSALRGDDIRPKVKKALAPLSEAAKTLTDAAKLDPEKPKPATTTAEATPAPVPEAPVPAPALVADHAASAAQYAIDHPADGATTIEPKGPTLPPSAGEAHDPDAPVVDPAEESAELAKLVRPAAGIVAQSKAPKSADGHG